MGVLADSTYYNYHTVKANVRTMYTEVFKLVNRDGVIYTHTTWDNNNPDHASLAPPNIPLTHLETLVIKALESQEGVEALANYLTLDSTMKQLTKKQYRQLLHDTINLMKEGLKP